MTQNTKLSLLNDTINITVTKDKLKSLNYFQPLFSNGLINNKFDIDITQNQLKISINDIPLNFKTNPRIFYVFFDYLENEIEITSHKSVKIVSDNDWNKNKWDVNFRTFIDLPIYEYHKLLEVAYFFGYEEIINTVYYDIDTYYFVIKNMINNCNTNKCNKYINVDIEIHNINMLNDDYDIHREILASYRIILISEFIKNIFSGA